MLMCPCRTRTRSIVIAFLTSVGFELHAHRTCPCLSTHGQAGEPTGSERKAEWAVEVSRHQHRARDVVGVRREVVRVSAAAWNCPADVSKAEHGAAVGVDGLAFHRALLGDDLLTPESVRLMTTNHLTEAQREASRLFLDGQGWGFGGGVDMSTVDPWRVPGRYGWVGGTGTSAYVTPSTGSIAILLTQVGVESPEATALLTDFWTYSAGEHR
ncbi:serine hydrolase [Kibdelosporangium lantanae]|uniref:Serine hydrolase n=1 Tax=Kibdelosporangium lantanae TaxID=1497396 RepID=A0ABW3M325_9PSEU